MNSNKLITMIKIIVTLFCCYITNVYAQSSIDYNKLGNKNDSLGNYKCAIKYYSKALKQSPNNNEILEKIVFAKSNIKKYRSGIDDNLNELIKLNPQNFIISEVILNLI
jgi:tetratricopeptide (TPR) repeat protein